MTSYAESEKNRGHLADILFDALRFSCKLNDTQKGILFDCCRGLATNNRIGVSEAKVQLSFLERDFLTLEQWQVIASILHHLASLGALISQDDVKYYDRSLRALDLDSIPGVEPAKDEDLRAFLKQL